MYSIGPACVDESPTVGRTAGRPCPRGNTPRQYTAAIHNSKRYRQFAQDRQVQKLDKTMQDSASTKQQQLRQLDSLVRRLETQGRRRWSERQPVSTSFAALDALLPEGGLARGTLVEWFMGGGFAAGAGALALRTAREAARHGGHIVVFDRGRQFYPPAAAAWGLNLSQVVVVRADSPRDELWSLDQTLRCQGVAAAWGYWEQLDWRWFRRLQLSAERGGTIGLLLRPAQVRGEPSWADVQWQVQPLPAVEAPISEGSVSEGSVSEGGAPSVAGQPWLRRPPWRLSVTLHRCRGGAAGQTVQVSL